ncbi:MAG: glycoside hydrolase family 28 protein [Lewinella sp.]
MKYFPVSFFLLLFISCQQSTPAGQTEASGEAYDPWDDVGVILNRIKAPEFPDRTFNLAEAGGVADGKTDCLPALTNLVEECAAAGGGMVLVPAGTYFVDGPIHLRSNVNLHLAEGATLKFSTDPASYLPLVLTRWEGVECYNYSPLVYAFDQENIAITGKGTLDGEAGNDNWWKWVDKEEFGWSEGMPSQSDPESRPKLFGWNTDEVPVAERKLGPGAYLRPNFIQPYNCRNVLIEGVTIRNSPMWVMNPVLCENVTILNVKVISHGPNSDGCDPEGCRDVLIKGCYFDTGDDCIALKSGRNQDGRRIGRPIENVVIQDCEMKDGHGGVVIGSEVSGGARNIYAENCLMDSPNLDRALRVKTNKTRGGTIENLYFRNITVGEVKEAVLRVNMLYPIYSDTSQSFIPVVRNIYVENVTSKKSKYGVLLEGFSAQNPIRNVHLNNCSFDGVTDGNKIVSAEDLHFQDLFVNGKPVE